MELPWPELLATLHESPWQLALVAAGGGSGAVGECFRHQGASRTFVDAAIPYAVAAMDHYLSEPRAGSSASLETAVQLAGSARRRCGRYASPTSKQVDLAGLACVAALPSDHRRHEHDRAHVVLCRQVAVDTQDLACWSIHFKRNGHSRRSAEDAVDACICSALAWLADFNLPFALRSTPDVRIEHHRSQRPL